MLKVTKKSKRAATDNGSACSLHSDLPQSKTAERNDKYLSTCSVNRAAMSLAKKQQSMPPQASATNASANTSSIRSFFGKLIRTSLVNINESGFGASTMDRNHKIKATAAGNNSKQAEMGNGSLIFFFFGRF
jgi:hypothetical protein